MTSRSNALRPVQVFERNRDAMERPAIVTGPKLLFGAAGLLAGQIGGYGNEAVEPAVDRFDPTKKCVCKFNRRDFFAPKLGTDGADSFVE